MLFKSITAFEGRVIVTIDEGPADVAPAVSKRYRFRLKPLSAAVAKATDLGTISILVFCFALVHDKKNTERPEGRDGNSVP
jgi:hypothetical protein